MPTTGPSLPQVEVNGASEGSKAQPTGQSMDGAADGAASPVPRAASPPQPLPVVKSPPKALPVEAPQPGSKKQQRAGADFEVDVSRVEL